MFLEVKYFLAHPDNLLTAGQHLENTSAPQQKVSAVSQSHYARDGEFPCLVTTNSEATSVPTGEYAYHVRYDHLERRPSRFVAVCLEVESWLSFTLSCSS